jgi:hypothetical protein
MTTVDETLKKANAALDVITEHDDQNSNCDFKQVLAEIIERWRDLK